MCIYIYTYILHDDKDKIVSVHPNFAYLILPWYTLYTSQKFALKTLKIKTRGLTSHCIQPRILVNVCTMARQKLRLSWPKHSSVHQIMMSERKHTCIHCLKAAYRMVTSGQPRDAYELSRKV